MGGGGGAGGCCSAYFFPLLAKSIAIVFRKNVERKGVIINELDTNWVNMQTI